MTKLNKGDLVRWRHRAGRNILVRERGIVLEESHDGATYRVRWFSDGLLGEHYRDDLVKIEVEGD